EGADRRADHGQKAVAEQGIAQGLLHQTEAAAAVVEGDALGTDGPARARGIVVAQVLADARQGMTDVDAERAQAVGLADAGQLQELRRVDRARADHDLARPPPPTPAAGT